MPKDTKPARDVADIAAEDVLQSTIDTGVLSTTACPAVDTKEPGKLIVQADGLDILKKASTRKGRCLMLLACQLSLVPGGQLGELEGMDTQTPMLYIAFPEGRFRLEGTFAYPRSRYTVLKLGSRQNVQLEHAFEHIVVFSKMVWVGSKEENPEEKKLPVPEDIKEAPEGDNRGTVVFGQGLGSEAVSARGSGQGATASPSKQRAQPSRRSRGKSARVVDSGSSEEDVEADEDADGDSGEAASLDATEEGAAKKTPRKTAKAAVKDKKTSPAMRRKAGGNTQAASGPEQSNRKRKVSEQTEDAEGSPADEDPPSKRRSSARSSQKPKYVEASEEEETNDSEGKEDSELQNDSDYSASE